jgi:aminoglycoside phosphotransferase (APT) family kinase protein
MGAAVCPGAHPICYRMELNVDNVAEYLRERNIDCCGASELGGGVSNCVLHIKTLDCPFILKQALPRLRVEDEWLADRSRIYREISALEESARILPGGSVPRVLWTDPDNYAFAMEAVPGSSWKEEIFAGTVSTETAALVGTLLGLFIAATWQRSELRERYGDQTAFYQLRIDPYYRTIAARHGDVASRVRQLIEESAARRVCLVHGDFSPKNLLIHNGRVYLIDFEVVHFGDPAFDAAFMLNHLAIKRLVLRPAASDLTNAIRGYWTALNKLLPADARPWFWPATARHLGCLMLARLDGKSPVEYIKDERTRSILRKLARSLIFDPPVDLEALLHLGVCSNSPNYK